MTLMLYINSCHFHLYLTYLQLAIKHADISDWLLITVNKCWGGLRCPRRLRMGGVGSGLLQARMTAWICMEPRYSWALSSADGAQHSGVPPAGSSVLLPQSSGISRSSSSSGGSARRGFAGAFASSCHIQPVSTSPGEIEIYTAELLVQREAITGAADIVSGLPVSQPPTEALKFSLRRVCLPGKVNPAFEEDSNTSWHYPEILLQYLCIMCII